MKKTLAFLVAVIVTVACFSMVGCRDRSELLKMYIPGEYLDEEIFSEFEDWYHEQTGKTVHVVTPMPFDAVEEIYPAIEKDHADYDLLCPSDYAVEYLIKKDLLIKVDKERVNVENVIKKEYVDLAKVSDPTLEYSVPYMYGTFGIMYDYSKTDEHINSWDALFTEKYKNKSANKDSLREAITSAAIWANREELFAKARSSEDADISNPDDWSYGTEYKAALKAIYEDKSKAGLDKAIAELENGRDNIWKIWGGEDLKFQMADENSNTDIAVALMWSCDAGYIMNEYEDDNGDIHPGNRNIWYSVPIEGSNIYIDNFVISKYAENVEAAQYFLEFICKKDIAIRNSVYAGAISPVADAYNELETQWTQKLKESPEYMDVDDDWKKMYLEMLFPTNDVIARCGTLRDYGEADGMISEAFNNVK